MRINAFFQSLMDDPMYARQTAKFKSIVTAYMRGMTVANICDTFGVTRTDVAAAINAAGVERGMDTRSMAPEDVANLYALLYAAQLEIERLRKMIAEDPPMRPSGTN